MKVDPKTVKFALDLVAAVAAAVSSVMGTHLTLTNRE